MAHGVQTDNPTTKFPTPIRIIKVPEHVKYGEGDDSYEGYKHSAVVLTGDEFPPTVTIHNREALNVGIYDLVVELNAEGKIKTRNHYVFNQLETDKIKKS